MHDGSGLDEQHRDNSGWTPLHYAAFEGHIDVCEALLEAGAKIDETDNDGKGALMLAAQEGHATLVEKLLEHHTAPIDRSTRSRWENCFEVSSRIIFHSERYITTVHF